MRRRPNAGCNDRRVGRIQIEDAIAGRVARSRDRQPIGAGDCHVTTTHRTVAIAVRYRFRAYARYNDGAVDLDKIVVSGSGRIDGERPRQPIRRNHRGRPADQAAVTGKIGNRDRSAAIGVRGVDLHLPDIACTDRIARDPDRLSVGRRRGGRLAEENARSGDIGHCPGLHTSRDSGDVGLRLIYYPVTVPVGHDRASAPVGACRRRDRFGKGATQTVGAVADRLGTVPVGRDRLLDPVIDALGRKSRGGGYTCGPVGPGEGCLALNRRTISQCLAVSVGLQVDRGHPSLRERFQRSRAICIRDQHAETRPSRVAGIEDASVIGVEDVLQRLHVGSRRRIPQRELKLIGLRDRPATGIVHEHTVPRASPGDALLIAVVRCVDEEIG